MRLSCILAGAIAATLLAAPATAANQKDIAECGGHTSTFDLAIAACTRILNSRAETIHNRAVIYDWRGMS